MVGSNSIQRHQFFIDQNCSLSSYLDILQVNIQQTEYNIHTSIFPSNLFAMQISEMCYYRASFGAISCRYQYIVTIFRHPSSFVSNYQPHWLIRCNQHYMVRFNETPNNQKCPYNPLSAARTMLYRRRDVWGCRFFFFLQLTLSVKKRTLGEKRKAKMWPEILMLCSKFIQIMKTPNTIHLSVVHMSRKSLPGIVWCETIHVNFSWYAHCE